MQHIVYPFDQRPCRERLREYKACPQAVCFIYDLMRWQSRHEDRRELVSALAHPLHDVKAALVRQQKIQQKNMRSVSMECLCRLVLIPCVKHIEVSSFMQGIRQQHTKSLIAV